MHIPACDNGVQDRPHHHSRTVAVASQITNNSEGLHVMQKPTASSSQHISGGAQQQQQASYVPVCMRIQGSVLHSQQRSALIVRSDHVWRSPVQEATAAVAALSAFPCRFAGDSQLHEPAVLDVGILFACLSARSSSTVVGKNFFLQGGETMWLTHLFFSNNDVQVRDLTTKMPVPG